MDGYLGPDWNMSMEMMGEYPIPVSDFHHIPEYNEATGYQVPFNTEVRAESSFQQYPLQLAGEAVPHDYAMQQQQHQHGVVGNGGSGESTLPDRLPISLAERRTISQVYFMLDWR